MKYNQEVFPVKNNNKPENTKEFNFDNRRLEVAKVNYEKVANTLAMIIEEISSISVPREIIQKWKILLASVCVVDDRIDHTIDEQKRIILTNEIIESLNKKEEEQFLENDQELKNAMLNVRNLCNNMENDQKNIFLNSLHNILLVTEKIKKEENPKKLVDLTRLEGQMTARIFLPFLPPEFRKSQHYRKLVLVLTRLGRVGNSFDSFLDLPSDYRNKQIIVKPTLLNQLLFISSMLPDGVSFLKNVGLSKKIIKKMLNYIDRSIKNSSQFKENFK